MSMIEKLSVAELAAWRAAGRTHCLIDVREAEEVAVCHISGSMTIPLGQIGNRIDELPRDAPIVAICHHGMRSARALQYLQSEGFEQLYNLEGGIDQWAIEVAPDMARY